MTTTVEGIVDPAGRLVASHLATLRVMQRETQGAAWPALAECVRRIVLGFPPELADIAAALTAAGHVVDDLDGLICDCRARHAVIANAGDVEYAAKNLEPPRLAKFHSIDQRRQLGELVEEENSVRACKRMLKEASAPMPRMQANLERSKARMESIGAELLASWREELQAPCD